MDFQRARIRRVRKMDSSAIREKLHGRVVGTFSYRILIRRLAYYLNVYSIRLHTDLYTERPEAGPQNIEVKHERVRQGGPFEPYSISVINRAATQLLGAEKSILEVGCGTGMFSYLAAADARRALTASELDEKTLRWTMEHRQRPNIKYCSQPLAEFGIDAFDIVVAVELVEHLADFSSFLQDLSCVAPAAIVTTPNKNRGPMESIANTPAYSEHVREWTSGEFYWVLRAFYSDVDMYTIPNFKTEIENYRSNQDFIPSLARCSVLECSEPLLALCKRPIRTGCRRKSGT